MIASLDCAHVTMALEPARFIFSKRKKIVIVILKGLAECRVAKQLETWKLLVSLRESITYVKKAVSVWSSLKIEQAQHKELRRSPAKNFALYFQYSDSEKFNCKCKLLDRWEIRELPLDRKITENPAKDALKADESKAFHPGANSLPVWPGSRRGQ